MNKSQSAECNKQIVNITVNNKVDNNKSSQKVRLDEIRLNQQVKNKGFESFQN